MAKFIHRNDSMFQTIELVALHWILHSKAILNLMLVAGETYRQRYYASFIISKRRTSILVVSQ